ncbi:mycobactin polyketide synthetase MbtD [Williamsia limnetica]|uniref:Mycobactin polyketide synthetase MbtD n=1 Tax=Williamsia limnetica TaxID=882452 RepID=A0A318RM46_WILLI|nr:nocobactin polyketide synthase NbtC [Williamsia limnetica]PYE16806.1 mycobactin polyketide synthetase MbtD [Williamsia limnetica]
MPRYELPDGRAPVLVSADTAELLRAEAAALAAYLHGHQDVQIHDVASMLMRTRVIRRHRALVLATDHTQLTEALESLAGGVDHTDVIVGRGAAARRTTGFVFPGQGSQRPGMGSLFYELSPVFRRSVDTSNALFQDLYDISPRDYLLGAESDEREDIRIVQPALLMQMVALAQMWRSVGVEPASTVGHSQGEIAAAYISGAMSLTDAIHVVTSRANLVVEFSPTGYSMAVVAIDRDECEAMLATNSGWAELSVVNSPHILCISGDRGTVIEMVEALAAEGKFAKEIRVDYPAHTSIVAKFRTKLAEAIGDKLENQTFLETDIGCLGGTLGKPVTTDYLLSDYWFWNLRNPVRFDLAIGAAVTAGADTFIEVAEHPTLMLAIGENLSVAAPDATIPVIGTSRRSSVDLGEFTKNLATVAVNDTGYRWEALAVPDDGAIPLPLRDFPAVQMKATSLWASHRAPGEKRRGPVAPPAGIRDEPRRIVETWTRLQRRKLGPPRSFLVIDHAGERSDLAAGLVASAPDHGATAFAYGANVAEGTFDSVVVVLPELAGIDLPVAVTELAKFFGNTQWLPDVATGAAECWLVTTGGEFVLPDDEIPQLFGGGVAAGFRCLSAEFPTTMFRHLDLSAEVSAETVVGALHTAGESDLALRGGKMYAKRLVYADPDAAAVEPGQATEDLSHVVIVGGTGKLGLEFCEHYALAGAERITLLSRTGASVATEPRLRAIRALADTDIVVASCDVGEESSVLQFAAAHENVPASVLVHAAVNYVDAGLRDITPAMVIEAAASKVLGIANVLRSFPLTPGCRVLLCSSIAASLGGRGQILYAVTNRLLDILARTLRVQGIDAYSLQWGLWSVQGPLDQAAVDRVEGAGVVPMRPADALAVAFDGTQRDSIIAAADWAELHGLVSVFGHGSLIAGLVAAPPLTHPDPVAVPVVETAPSSPVVGTAPSGPAVETSALSFSELVVAELNRVMGIDGGDIDPSTPLVALGLDSLQALDFRKRVKAELDRDLPMEAILGGASLDEVVALMDEQSGSRVG